MRKLFVIVVALLMPVALMAAEDMNKQIDKTPKGQPLLTDKHNDAKQGKPPELALDARRFEFVRTNLVSTFYHQTAVQSPQR